MFRLFGEYYLLLRCNSVNIMLSKLCHCCPFSRLWYVANSAMSPLSLIQLCQTSCSFPIIIEFAWIGNMRLWNKVDVSFCATKHHSGSNESPEWCFVSWKNAWCHGGSKRSKTWTLNRESAQRYVLYVRWEKQGGVECWRMQKRLQSCHIEVLSKLSTDKWQFCLKRERRRFRLLAITEPGK